MASFYSVIEYFLTMTFGLLDLFFLKKRYIVFSCRSAKDYADNSKILFEEFLARDVLDVFFYTKSKSVLGKIPRNGIYAYSLKGFYILLKSKSLVFTHGSGDFFPYSPPKSKNRKFINLFHAIAIKKVGHNNVRKVIRETEKWDYFIVSSEFEAEFIQEQYSFAPQKIKILGQPRNDILCSHSNRLEDSNKKVILYAPTFRDNSITRLFPFEDKDLKNLDKLLGMKNMEIMIRLHINEEKKYKSTAEYKGLKNIYFAGSNQYPSVNDILWNIDAVITDYSSVCIDYLLLDRPIAYIPYDYNDYDNERGFSFDYYKYAAGEIIDSQKKLETFLEWKEDTFKDKRIALKNLFHKYQDGKSSERLFNFINNL